MCKLIPIINIDSVRHVSPDSNPTYRLITQGVPMNKRIFGEKNFQILED